MKAFIRQNWSKRQNLENGKECGRRQVPARVWDEGRGRRGLEEAWGEEPLPLLVLTQPHRPRNPITHHSH